MIKVVAGVLSQTGADTLTELVVQSALFDNDNFVLSVLRFEVEFLPNSFSAWPPAVDAWMSVALSNEKETIYNIGWSKSVIATHALAQRGVAAAATDYIVSDLLKSWEPPQGKPLYLFNETYIVSVNSSATGFVNSVAWRLYYEKVAIPSLEKTALKTA